MASVHLPSGQSVFVAHFRVWDAGSGSWKQKTATTETGDRDKAQLIADQYEALARSLTPGAPSRHNAVALMRRIRAIFDASDVAWPGDDVGEGPPFAAFAEDWLQRRAGKVKESTRSLYGLIVGHWKEFLGNGGTLPMGALTTADAQRWYDEMVADGLSTGTAQNKASIISGIYERAVAVGAIKRNPFAAVERHEVKSHRKNPFSVAEEKLIFEHLEKLGPADWLTACMVARWTGMRLWDAANLKGENVSQVDGVSVITFHPQKKSRTGGPVMVPAIEPLAGYLSGLEATGSLCPSLAGRDVGGHDGLSTEFAAILGTLEIDRGKIEARGAGRNFYRLGFHSWRHTLTSRLAEAGVPSELRRLMTDHADEKVHARYTHVGALALSKQLEGYLKP